MGFGCVNKATLSVQVADMAREAWWNRKYSPTVGRHSSGWTEHAV